MVSRVTLSMRAMAGEQKNRLAQRAETAISHLGAEKHTKIDKYIYSSRGSV